MITIAHNGQCLTFTPETNAYALESCGRVWTMSRNPYVMFADGRRVEFPAPTECKAGEDALAVYIDAVYQGFDGSETAVLSMFSSRAGSFTP